MTDVEKVRAAILDEGNGGLFVGEIAALTDLDTGSIRQALTDAQFIEADPGVWAVAG
jgi:hypothetical protein